MKNLIIFCSVLLFSFGAYAQPQKKVAQTTGTKSVTLTKSQLKDKIMGGWAGQTIGVTFGGPYEFKYNGTFIQDYQPLVWHDGYIKETMINIPELYDDLYMDLTFVDVFERLGFNAPVDSFANAFAQAEYKLWHANQAARYNILNGLKGHDAGHWKNNPHADDIDYQIEADYAGLMSPGMPNTASEISDKVGHIMNYGDGWYGGVYMGAMYSLAFVYDNVPEVVNEALKTIPKESNYYKCIADVIAWHKKYPNDWHQTWLEVQKKWSSDLHCPNGVFHAFNIDATINSAYVVMGLLYGNGDFARTLEISTRAGQDADCNPSSAAGILGTIVGYNKIPAKWKMGLKEAEDINFKYTTISLNKVYDIGLKHAIENVTRNGGTVAGDHITLAVQTPAAVKYEKSFPNLYPIANTELKANIKNELSFDFEGTGFIWRGEAKTRKAGDTDYVFEAELYIDGKKVETAKLPTSFTTRRLEFFWNYALPNKKHNVKIKVLNPNKNYDLRSVEYIVFSDRP
jgi:hypothetical protein